MRVAAVQMTSGASPAENRERACVLVREAAEAGAQYIQLPEYLNYMGPPERNQDVAEGIPGPTTEALAALAVEYRAFVHAGSILSQAGFEGKSANTSVLIDPHGEIAAVYRKVHLFDINLPGQVVEQESATIVAGSEVITAKLDDFMLGMSVCFDIRFPELYRALVLDGANVLAVPAAFAVPTGRVHWEVLMRARAIENHAYVVAAAQAGETEDGFASYGHSMIVDPWGTILAEAQSDGEDVVVAELDLAEVQRRRAQIAFLSLRRPDVYEGTHA